MTAGQAVGNADVVRSDDVGRISRHVLLRSEVAGGVRRQRPGRQVFGQDDVRRRQISLIGLHFCQPGVRTAADRQSVGAARAAHSHIFVGRKRQAAAGHDLAVGVHIRRIAGAKI